ncbi:MAG TPA: hypothetical protein DCL77_08980 [Prolixibacteraceae bacterium]|jgi:hypothetical protein|nr:hypothetical protein [Prolixibacteraceae bacterium]
MDTFEKLVYNIAENVHQEHDLVFLERLRFMVQYYRATLIRRDDEKGRKLDSAFLQIYLGSDDQGIAMEEKVDHSCLIMQSTEKIPNLIRLRSGPAIKAVTNLSTLNVIHPIEFEAVRSYAFNKHTGFEARYYYRDGYLYTVNSITEHLALEGAFEYPTLVNPNEDYPVPLDFVQQITTAILAGELRGIQPNESGDSVTVNG